MASLLYRTFGYQISSFVNRWFIQPSHHHNHSHNNNHKTNKRFNMPKGRPISLQTVELKVRMCCTGCERVVKNAIYKLKGIDSVKVDLEMERVTVTGYVERNKVLKAVRRSGKRAEFWPYPNPPLYFTSASHYYKDTTNEFKESYNYYRHGYNLPDRHGTIHVTQRGDDQCVLYAHCR